MAGFLYILCVQLSSRESSLSLTPSCTPVSSGQIPKYGTLIPNRIFVGGLPADVCTFCCFQCTVCMMLIDLLYIFDMNDASVILYIRNCMFLNDENFSIVVGFFR